MKKTIIFSLLFSVLLLCCACGTVRASSDESETAAEPVTESASPAENTSPALQEDEAAPAEPAPSGSDDPSLASESAEISTEPPEPAEEPKASEEEPHSRILVACFSATGHTEPIAQYIAETLSADYYEIVPAEPYTDADLNYSRSDSRATAEQNSEDSRPEIAGELPDLTDYEIILIGHPIWWGQAPKIIYTFLESCDFSGKTLVTFCTSASSPLGTSAENLHACVPDTAVWLESRRFAIGADNETVLSWLREIGLCE